MRRSRSCASAVQGILAPNCAQPLLLAAEGSRAKRAGTLHPRHSYDPIKLLQSCPQPRDGTAAIRGTAGTARTGGTDGTGGTGGTAGTGNTGPPDPPRTNATTPPR